jgi:hypothetical protein
LVLHTLPPAQSDPAGKSSEHPEDPAHGTSKIPSATMAIPRLISVAEIVKREYLKKLHSTGQGKVSGLHQYNKIGALEDLGISNNTKGPAEDTTTAVGKALMGKD